MASNSGSEGYVIRSAARPGHKRELEDALRTQSELSVFSLPRTRSKNNKVRDIDNHVEDSRPLVRSDPINMAERSSLKPILVGDSFVVAKKSAPTKVPVTAEDLIGSGFIDGKIIEYLPGQLQDQNEPQFMEQKDGPRATINEGRLFCYCGSCCGYTPVPFSVFQQHAGCTEENALSYLFFENKTSIHYVLKACSVVSRNFMEMAIERMVGGLPSKKAYKCHICKELFQTPLKSNFRLFCSSCLDPRRAREAPPTITNISSIESSSSKVSACKTATSGQAAKKNMDLHKLVFTSGIFEGFSVWYVARNKGVREGRLEGSSIYCLRAGKVISPSQFEDLAGWAKWRKPYDHICLRNGVSLHQLAVCLAKNPDLSDSEKDSLRRACADLHVDERELLHFGLSPRPFHIGVPELLKRMANKVGRCLSDNLHFCRMANFSLAQLQVCAYCHVTMKYDNAEISKHRYDAKFGYYGFPGNDVIWLAPKSRESRDEDTSRFPWKCCDLAASDSRGNVERYLKGVAKIRWPQLFEQVNSSMEEWIIDQMHILRPVVETGYENLLLIRLLVEIQVPSTRVSSVADGLTINAILEDWSQLKPIILREWNEERDALVNLFGGVRVEWIEKDLVGWIGANRLYPGVADALKFASSQVYIVTTKQSRFADALLQELAGVTISSDRIYGLGTGPKVEVLRKLQAMHEHEGLTLHFVEDRLATLKNVIKEPALDGWNLYLGRRGYNTEKERKEAEGFSRIQLLDLADFSKKLK